MSGRTRIAPVFTDPTAYVLQIHRASGDTWHSFASLQAAAEYGVEVLNSVVDGRTYPLAIWHQERKLWKPFGKNGKLHVASTKAALLSLARSSE